MPDQRAVFRGSFSGPDEPVLRRGRRPVIFDVLAPDRETSLLDMAEQDLRLVLHVNPRTMRLGYNKQTERILTRGGFVEYHWGDAVEDLTFDAATGGFMRMYTGLSNITSSGGGQPGRRDTIAYDKYLDLLALFHNNGAIYDMLGNIVLQGYIKIIFDGGVHVGWFDGQFTVTEEASNPYMFSLSARFLIDREIMQFRSAKQFDYVTQAPTVPGGLGESPEGSTSTVIADPFVGLEGRGYVGPTAVPFRPRVSDPFEEDL
jgi:hypothetical protein